MTSASPTELLVLHAVRLRGMADAPAVAARFGLDLDLAAELLGDFEAYGWVTRSDFAGAGGWSLTAAGKARNEQQLAAELAEADAGAVVLAVHRDFLPSNEILQQACTSWQLRPTPDDALAPNRHDDPAWDARVLDALGRIGGELQGLESRLTAVLRRFGGYSARFGDALARGRRGEVGWVTGVGLDSCHTVWMELHEDLLATLGLERGAG